MTRRALVRGASVALAVALLTGCGAQQSVQPSSGESTPLDTPEPTSPASPSLTAEPTPETAAELVLRITHAYFGSHWTATSLMTDGRWTSPSDSGWQVQVLAPSGIERVRAEVVETGLFEESAEYPLVPVPNQDIGCTDGLGLTFGAAIELAAGTGSINASWAQTNAPEGCYEPSAARDALNTLLARLESLDDWLPADAWQDSTPRPYQAKSFRLITIAQPWQKGVGSPPEGSSVAWPLADSITTYGDAIPSPLFAEHWTVRCNQVSSDEAELVRDALVDAGATMSDSVPAGFASATLLGDTADELTLAVILESLPPDQTGCAEVDYGFLNCWQVGAIPPFQCAIP